MLPARGGGEVVGVRAAGEEGPEEVREAGQVLGIAVDTRNGRRRPPTSRVEAAEAGERIALAASRAAAGRWYACQSLPSWS